MRLTELKRFVRKCLGLEYSCDEDPLLDKKFFIKCIEIASIICNLHILFKLSQCTLKENFARTKRVIVYEFEKFVLLFSPKFEVENLEKKKQISEDLKWFNMDDDDDDLFKEGESKILTLLKKFGKEIAIQYSQEAFAHALSQWTQK